VDRVVKAALMPINTALRQVESLQVRLGASIQAPRGPTIRRHLPAGRSGALRCAV